MFQRHRKCSVLYFNGRKQDMGEAAIGTPEPLAGVEVPACNNWYMFGTWWRWPWSHGLFMGEIFFFSKKLPSPWVFDFICAISFIVLCYHFATLFFASSRFCSVLYLCDTSKPAKLAALVNVQKIPTLDQSQTCCFFIYIECLHCPT